MIEEYICNQLEEDAKHIGHDRIQSHIANSECILKAVFLAALHRYQF